MAEFFDTELLARHATGILPDTASPKSALPALKQDLLRTSANKINRYSSRSKLKKTSHAK
jgi:hypothetical protein